VKKVLIAITTGDPIPIASEHNSAYKINKSQPQISIKSIYIKWIDQPTTARNMHTIK